MSLRHPYIDRAKGLAIILVVLGHVVANQPPPGGEWYWALKDRIYAFHMPLFLFLSGLAYGFSFRAPTGVADYGQGLRRRTARLLGGYLAVGLLIFVGKLAFQQFTVIDNPVRGSKALLDLLLRPTDSVSRFLWYVYALSVLYAAVPLLFKAAGERMWPLVVLAASLPLLPASALLAWNKIQLLALYFVMGICAARQHHAFERLLHRVWPVALAVFAVLIAGLPEGWPWQFLLCACAIVGLLGMLRAEVLGDMKRLQYVGTFTLSIYLFNTLVIGVAKALWVALIGWEGVKFIPAFCAIAVAGIWVPMLLKTRLFSRVAVLDRIT